MELTGVLNELSRSMGLADFYPFVLSRLALRKLHLVHRIVQAQQPQAPLGHPPAPNPPDISTFVAPPASLADNSAAAVALRDT